MRSLWVLVSTTVIAIGSVACGLTASFAGLQGGPGTAFDADSGPVTLAEASSDAGTAGDAATSKDAGTDGDADAGGSTKGFCASLTTPVKLCTDFDEGAPLDAGWGATDIYGGEAVSLGTTAFSQPYAFLSSINPTGAPSSARLEETLPTLAPSVHLEFEMLLSSAGDGTMELGVVHEVTEDGTTYGLFYRVVNGALQVELKTLEDDGGVVDQTWPIGAPPTGWTHVEIDVEISDNGSFTVQQGGSVVLDETNQPTSTDSRTAMFVEIGLYSFAPTSGTASFDNAIVDWPQ